MPGKGYQVPYTYLRCLRAPQKQHAFPSRLQPTRAFSSSPPKSTEKVEGRDRSQADIQDESKTKSPEQGAMSRRLAEATEDALFEGGRAGRQAVEDAGFSEELKEKLLEKIKAANFRSENASAFAESEMAYNIGRGSREIATAQAWTGIEATEDTVLRMLDDAKISLKPSMRGPAKIPNPVDLRLKPKPKLPPGQRLANARDKTSIYAISKDMQMSEEEREEMRRDLKERFTPGARAMPNTIRGLAALANERIEDAIARGQFKNIPRGKAIERDARADNPFIDTTEYIMNKMIQRQDIVPPWIEKQQELVKSANIFRARIRNDWKRHAARTIASRGGTLQDQMRTADRYAEAEKIHNPKKRDVEQITVPTNATNNPVILQIKQEPKGPIKVYVETPTNLSPIDSQSNLTSEKNTTQAIPTPLQDQQENSGPLPAPFRIPSWEAAELSYLNLAITNLNNLTRSYNLMAPDLAKKPYFSLERELKSCYADVAPQLSAAIKERALKPQKDLIEKIGHRPGGVLERFASDTAKIYDSKRPLYGFKEFWDDLWGDRRT